MKRQNKIREFPRNLPLSGWFGKSILFFAAGLVPLVGFSVDYSLTQESSPAGFFSATTQTASANSMLTSLSPILRKDGYRFTHWTISGQRQVDGNGSSRITFSVHLDSNKTTVAHYLPETQDSDADGFPDWLEIRTYGNLDRNGSDDADNDGFSLKREQEYGLTPTIKDEIRQGNIARRRSHKISLNFGGALQLTVKSDPPGIVTTDKSLFDINSSHLSPQPPEKRAGYAFGYWTLNGQRVADSTGTALPRVPFELNGSMELVAKYFPENQDSDSDGLPDWQEWNVFGNLSQDETSDGDNDGFTTGDEVRYGLNASIKDEIRQGNIARRRSKKVFLNLGGAKKLSIGSDPPGFVARSETNPDVNASYLAPNPTRKLSGYAFAYWTRNGTRVADPTGTAIAQPNGVLETDVELVARYLPEKQDSDKDGTPDWQEWNVFGNLDHNASVDEDNDGFLLAKELQYGLHPAIPDIIAQGGISRRRSHRVSMPMANLEQNQSTEDRDGDGLNQAQELALGLDPDKADTDGDGFSDGQEYSRGSNPHDPSSLGNYPPSGIFLDNNHTYENLSPGSIVGDFNATDPDPGSIHSFSLVQGIGSQHNHNFLIDANGTLRTAVSFDYETALPPLSIRVRVSDEFHASLEQNFLINLLDQNEPPIDLNITAPLQVLENQSAGTLVGQFTAEDPDLPTTLTYTLVEGALDNHFFDMELNGTLRTATPLDYETNTTLSIRAKVRDQQNAWIKQNFTVQVLNILEDFDGDGIEDHLDPDDDGDGFSDVEEIAYGSDPLDPNSVSDTLPTDITLSSLEILENQPIGTIVGQFQVIDPDPKDTHIVRFNDLNANNSHNHLFTIDSNNTLRTAVVFDFEDNNTTLMLRVKAKQNQVGVFWKFFTLSVLNDSGDDSPTPNHDHNQTIDSNATQPPLDDGNETQDHNATQAPIVDGNDSLVDQNQTTVEAPVNPKYVPIVRTQEVSLNDKGTYVFRGRILTNGGAEILEAGIELSQSLRFSDPRRISAEVIDGKFQLKVKNLTPGTRYYYRAFARNEMGKSPGTRKRLKVPALPLPTAWWANMPNAGNGWVESVWFGAFQKFDETEWIYHTQLGWIYAPADSQDGIWLWMDSEGWLWTSRRTWPYTWKQLSGSWLYFQGQQKDGKPLFFDYDSYSWR